MKTQTQIVNRIYELRQDNHKAGEVLKIPMPDARKELMQNEMYARNNQIIALQWVLEG